MKSRFHTSIRLYVANVCCVSEQLVVYKATESKRYDFQTSSAEYAAEIVNELKKGISPYREV